MKKSKSKKELIIGYWIKRESLVDVKTLERRRWAIQMQVERCASVRRSLFLKLKKAQGAHSKLVHGYREPLWYLYFYDDVHDSVDRVYCSEPKTPKNFSLGMDLITNSRRLEQLLKRLDIFTNVLIFAIKQHAALNIAKISQSDGVTNYIINGRYYLFSRLYSRYRSSDPMISFELIACSNPFNVAPYQDVIL